MCMALTVPTNRGEAGGGPPGAPWGPPALLVHGDGERCRGVLDVDEVVALGQAGERDRTDRRTLPGLGQLVGPDAVAGLGVELVTGLLRAGDGGVGEDDVVDRRQGRPARRVVRLEHDPGVGRVGDVSVVRPDALEGLVAGEDPDRAEHLLTPEVAA